MEYQKQLEGGAGAGLAVGSAVQNDLGIGNNCNHNVRR